MKLRIRSTTTKETLKVEAPDPCTLSHLKTLIAAKLPQSTFPESIRLSLNREDELVTTSPDDSLNALGLTSGDLLFFSLASGPENATLNPSLVGPGGSSNLAAVPPANAPDPVSEILLAKKFEEIQEEFDVKLGKNSKFEQNRESEERKAVGETSTGTDQYECSMDVDRKPIVVERSLSIPGFLQKVMDAEKGVAEGILGRLVITVHAALLESGLVLTGNDGSRLPEKWADNVTLLSVRYTVPELLYSSEGKDTKLAILKFLLMGNYATAYAYLSVDRPDVYRVCFDLSKLALLLSSDMNSLSKSLEKEVFELWKLVKDRLSLPLLTDICLKNDLPLPPCFMLLPTDLKIKVLEFAAGDDIARFGCTCSEMRYLSSNDELWKQKLTEEFGLLDERELVGSTWKAKFANCWTKKMHGKKTMAEASVRSEVYAPRVWPFRTQRLPQRFPVIGGDYDLFPGGRPAMSRRVGNSTHPHRRNFSPDCYLGDI